MADDVKTAMIEIAGPAGKVRAFEARPTSRGPHPAVIVIQEWWGLNPHIENVAQRFAREGYLVVAPDLYSRQGNQVTTDPTLAGKLMGGLAKPDGVADLLAVAAHIKKEGSTNGRIGVTGYCMGGSFTTLLACHTVDVHAAAAFYGEVPDDATLAKLKCPLLYLWGGKDFWIQRADVERLSATLKRLHNAGEVVIYEDAPHAFFNDTRPDVYRPDDAKDAWERTLKLFASNLKR